jgi:hypothetical protein
VGNVLAAERQVDLTTPIVIVLTGLDMLKLNAQRGGPNAFNQELLARLKQAGGPVEGLAWLRLKYGALARVKPSMEDARIGRFRYMWISDETVKVVAEGIKQEQQLADWNKMRAEEEN